MTPLPGQSRLAALVRRARLALALDGAADGFAVAAAAGGIALLVLRWSPLTWSTSAPWIALGVVMLAAVACGLLRQARRAPTARQCAAWLDRRAGLGGLLLARLEVTAPAWDAELDRRLAAAPDTRPTHAMRRPVARLLLPALFLAGVVALPTPRDPSTARGAALGVLLEDLQARLDTLEQSGSVERTDADDLRERLTAMDERLISGDPLAWSELDRLAQELELSAQESAGELATARDEADALAAALTAAAAGPGVANDGSGAGDETDAAPSETSPEAAAALAKLLARLDAQGLLAKLPAGLASRLDADGDGKPDVPLSAADAAALANALADALAGQYDQLVAQGLADPAAAERLAQASKAEWEAALREGHQHTKECSGGT